MDFPIPPEDLAGLFVLLMLIPRDDTHTAYFFSGFARCDGQRMSLFGSGSFTVPPIEGPREALSGFDPRLLPRLVERDSYDRLARLVRGVEACVVMFVDSAPGGGLELKDPFFGLAVGAAGQPLLFQGDPDLRPR